MNGFDQLVKLAGGGPLGIVSPHLDDAVLSLGGIIGALTKLVRVDVVTVFAYDLATPGVASPWDGASGFATSAHAGAARRDEDAAACRILGANPVWLPFDGPMPPPGSDELDALRRALGDALSPYPAVAIPGFPLHHPDHYAVAGLVEAIVDSTARLATYAEQPYRASGHRLVTCSLRLPARTAGGRAIAWHRSPLPPAARRAKAKAIAEYRSQIKPLGPVGLGRMFMLERVARGEMIGIADEVPNRVPDSD
jgi:LmbE family N-acetylglucosaminyl deacetylase